jgi:hypothetical protein
MHSDGLCVVRGPPQGLILTLPGDRLVGEHGIAALGTPWKHIGALIKGC